MHGVGAPDGRGRRIKRESEIVLRKLNWRKTNRKLAILPPLLVRLDATLRDSSTTLQDIPILHHHSLLSFSRVNFSRRVTRGNLILIFNEVHNCLIFQRKRETISILRYNKRKFINYF